jgi:hypothetical protein
MESGLDLEKRVSILEVEMNWATGTVQDIKKDLEILKNSQFQLLDRISSLQAETMDRISALQAHTDEKFIAVHKEISGIHKAISAQTKWLLTVILAAAAIISILHPIMQKLL